MSVADVFSVLLLMLVLAVLSPELWLLVMALRDRKKNGGDDVRQGSQL